jgi:tripartite tricarboxylate transporter TctB family protein
VSLVRHVLFPALALVLAAVYALSIRDLSGSALAYPAIVATVVLGLGFADVIAELIRTRRTRSGPEDAYPYSAASVVAQTSRGWELVRVYWRQIVLVVALALYTFGMQVVGFYAATLAFLFGTFVLLRVSVLRAVITALCCVPVMYIVFTVLFQITTLPRGLLI